MGHGSSIFYGPDDFDKAILMQFWIERFFLTFDMDCGIL